MKIRYVKDNLDRKSKIKIVKFQIQGGIYGLKFVLAFAFALCADMCDHIVSLGTVCT